MRLFFAIELAPEVVDRVLSVRDRLASAIGGDGVRWVQKAQIHLTLAFLGEQSEERARVAIEAARPIAAAHARFELSVGGLGAFPDDAHPRVLFLGIAGEGTAPLVALATELTGSLTAAGFTLDSREFHPHVTLARVDRGSAAKKVSRLVGEGGFDSLGVSVIDRLALLESRPDPSYVKLEELPLH